MFQAVPSNQWLLSTEPKTTKLQHHGTEQLRCNSCAILHWCYMPFKHDAADDQSLSWWQVWCALCIGVTFLCSSLYVIQLFTIHVCVELENEINLGPPAVTTDVEKYVDLLMDCYNDGFTLATFVRVPEVHMYTDVTDWISDQPYQVILTKQDATGYVSLSQCDKATNAMAIPSDRCVVCCPMSNPSHSTVCNHVIKLFFIILLGILLL